MNSKFTLTRLAEATNSSIGGDEEQKKRIHRQLRNVLTQNLISPSDTVGGRRDAVFDLREAAKARIQVAIIDAGLDAVTLKSIADFWDRAVDARLRLPALNGNFPPFGLDAMLYDTSRPGSPDWSFVIKIRREVRTGERIVYAAFVRADQPDFPETEPMSCKGPFADNSEILTIATITIPVTVLVRPLIEEQCDASSSS